VGAKMAFVIQKNYIYGKIGGVSYEEDKKKQPQHHGNNSYGRWSEVMRVS